MTGRWFRFYDEALDDPKVQRLSAEDFRAWVNLLCVASRNGGKLPALSDIAFALRTDENGARTVLERLSNGGVNGGLIDRLTGGVNGYHYAPHSWEKRQYKSDTSTDRVKRFRERSETVPETPSDTETEAEKKVVAKATTKRASRIPDIWLPGALPGKVQVLVEQWPDGREDRLRDEFHDYWKNRQRDAARINWDTAWHNRIRDQHDRIMRENRNGNGSANGRGGQANEIQNPMLRAAMRSAAREAGG